MNRREFLTKTTQAAIAGALAGSDTFGEAGQAPRVARQGSSDPQKPNIMVVVMDDVGYSDLGCYGGEIRTPHIDSLARDGLRYTRFDTNAVCSPTRASLLTGRNSQTVKMGFLAATNTKAVSENAAKRPQLEELLAVDPGWRDPKDQSPMRGWMPRNAETIAQALKLDGYATWAIGKWHLAPHWEDGSPGNNADFPPAEGLRLLLWLPGRMDGSISAYFV